MKIENGRVVDLAYILKNEKGEILDETDAESPLVYLHGAGNLEPGLEKALEGLTQGDKKNVVLTPEEGFGEIDPELKMTVKKSSFPSDFEVKPGVMFEASGAEGENAFFTIDEIAGDEVYVNGNHPWAGETLNYQVEVLGVREATAEEQEHGHPHGADGHHHDHDSDSDENDQE